MCVITAIERGAVADFEGTGPAKSRDYAIY